MKINVVAPACPVKPHTPDKVRAVAARMFGIDAPDIDFHPQCFLVEGHFAGSDAERSAAFLEAANDPSADAVWFGRGGYGSCRLADDVWGKLGAAARRKTYMGYSDLGVMLARLYREGIGRCVHGPMPSDVNRDGGEEAIARALRFLVLGDRDGIEPSGLSPGRFAAFNITILSQILGTPHEPDLSGHVVMIEDVGEYLYRLDRALFHITSNAMMRRAAGIRLGRVSDIPDNDPPFLKTAEEIVGEWCRRAGIAYLGAADIGHDSENKIVPFGADPAIA